MNYPLPVTEGERVSPSEVVMENKLSSLRHRLATDPASMTLVGDYLTNIDLMWSWTQRCACRDGATYADQRHAEAQSELRDLAWAAVQAMFRTPEGKELREAVAQRYAGEVRLW